MFQHLSKYLCKYNQVSIPQIGTIELMPKPASLDLGDKVAFPPSYTIEYSGRNDLPQHQLIYLALHTASNNEVINEDLEVFGNQLRKHLSSDVFLWKGIGKIETVNGRIKFSPEFPVASGLQPIPALKVLRQNVAHTVLRGETEGLSSDDQKKGKRKKDEKRSVVVIAGWVLVALAVGFIFFHLYQASFRSTSSGTRMKVMPKPIEPSHK